MNAPFTERRDERHRLVEGRRLALAAAATAISRHVPDLPGLVANLKFAGGSSRLIAALKAPPVAEVPLVGGAPRPDAVTWGDATERMVRR